jgi:hypothetical protein
VRDGEWEKWRVGLILSICFEESASRSSAGEAKGNADAGERWKLILAQIVFAEFCSGEDAARVISYFSI